MTSEPTIVTPLDPSGEDPFGWLEEVDGGEALAWVRARNEEAHASVGSDPVFAKIEAQILEVLDSDDQVPEVSRLGEHLYNFWRDADHERGIWRRTTPESYRTEDPDWELLLDLDALAAEEDESWVWHGASMLRPEPGEPWRKVLIDLSPGGSDADVTREFDLVTKAFVSPADGGFTRAVEQGGAKGALSWCGPDAVYVFTDFGPGSLTPSGYPRIVKLWRRGTPFEDAAVVYEGTDEDMYISARHIHTPGFERDLVSRSIAFYKSETYVATDPGTPEQTLTKLDIPDSAEAGFHREWLVIELREEWTVAGTTYAAGSLLATDAERFLAGERDLTVLFEPTAKTSLAGATWTRNHLVLNVFEDVKNRLHVLTPSPSGEWARSAFPATDPVAAVGTRAVDAVESDEVWVVTSGYLTPATYGLTEIGAETIEPLKSAPAWFDTDGLRAEQRFATSVDSTRIPYFIVGAEAALAGNGRPAPTLLYGYGGFEIPMTPGYSAGVGRSWLSEGGVYVVANIRGGGEYGPAWHQAALKENRHKAYEDFAAVARHLAETGVTDAQHLGIQGGSNGGLLTGNMLTLYPELFGAVVIQVPLLDMKRYSHLLAGASWMAEYGDPDVPEEWEFIKTFSPYHLLDGARTYPPVLLTTSTKDDRVHPGHARKMAALLAATGKDVTYYENIEGGHGGAANNAQSAHLSAFAWTFLRERLGLID
ncbi:prolyl oligopeptidase family serine peptidase [Nocardioides albus]|uniref:Prolyl oligopeptidase n=1 Tax=Nocardioides albus TaxID=1841 RepID=A0A7W5F9F3_9ACTN|nr:prolyl oligopeptidase family serine peptidase [Nocardioides albus]MBB3090175.1 prolyl oligopeptidase [Nocardioides albus]GGU28240.1 prolyl oligopeptidase [Nocardioides albus]